MATSRRIGLARSESVAHRAAYSAYLKGDFETALSFLEIEAAISGAPDIRSRLLRCRIERVAGDDKAFYESASHAATLAVLPADRLTATAFLAAASRRLGRDAEAGRAFEQVAREIERPNADALEAAYLLALDLWQRRDYDASEAIVRRFSDAGYGGSLLLQLSGWTAVKREQYARAGKLFSAALRASREEEPYLRSLAIILHGIALVACDTVDLKLCRLAIREYDKIEWTSDLWFEHCNLLLCLRYCRMLEGDSTGAWADARRAVIIAKKPMYEAMGELLAAGLSQKFGDSRAFEIQLTHAWELIKSIRWSEANSAERMTLSEFAIIAATAMPAEARKALVLLRSLRAKRDTYNALDGDRRAEAFETWADGRIHEAGGMRSDAVALLKQSYAVFGEIGYILRQAYVGLDLYRLTADLRWLEAYENVKAIAPEADISVSAVAGDEMPRLTPAQTRVLIQLLDGQSAKAGAEVLGCSAYTFTNHTRKVFEAFEVRSRDALKERCAELGISAQALRSAGYR